MQPDVLRVLQTKGEIRAFYNKISRAYDLLADRSEGPLRRRGLEMLAVEPGSRVLEIGFGSGHSLIDLALAVGPRGRVHGIDLSDEMASVSRRRLASSGCSDTVSLVLGDAELLPFAAGSFDFLFTSFTLELFDTPDIPKVLAECRRVLRPGGRMGVVALTKSGPSGFAVRAYEWTHRHFPNLLDCRPIYAERSLTDAGFEIVGAGLDQMWVPVEIVVAQKPSNGGDVQIGGHGGELS